MGSEVLHIKIGDRRTTISLPTEILRLAEIQKNWGKRELENWLSERLSERLGQVPRGTSSRPGLSRYALDEILSIIVRPSVWRQLEEERYGIK